MISLHLLFFFLTGSLKSILCVLNVPKEIMVFGPEIDFLVWFLK